MKHSVLQEARHPSQVLSEIRRKVSALEIVFMNKIAVLVGQSTVRPLPCYSYTTTVLSAYQIPVFYSHNLW